MPIVNMSLSIDISSDSIQGSIAIENEEAKPFYGWVELATAIETARARALHAIHPGVASEKD